MNKLVIVYYVWKVTASNHTGMAHLVKALKSAYPENIIPIEIPNHIHTWNRFRKHCFLIKLSLTLKKKFNNAETRMLFMEFFGGSVFGNQTRLASYLFQWRFKGQLIGMIHLPPFKIDELYKKKRRIKKLADNLDRVVVMGSSLANYLNSLNINPQILTVPHYVDQTYYRPAYNRLTKHKRLQVISMGHIFRDNEMLFKVANQAQFADFHICAGKRAQQFSKFNTLPNVKIYGYLQEEELLMHMQKSDIGLSTLADTIGSNVIVTYLAVGLPQIVSDVGSIRDYCNENNAIFCKTANDFVSALSLLNDNRERLKNMGKAALEKSGNFKLEKVLAWFGQNILEA